MQGALSEASAERCARGQAALRNFDHCAQNRVNLCISQDESKTCWRRLLDVYIDAPKIGGNETSGR
jgi:hypothetical protein